MDYRKYLNYAIFLVIVLAVVGLAVRHSRHMRALVDAMAGTDREARIAAAMELVAGEQFMDAITGEGIITRVKVVQALEDWAMSDKHTIQDPKDPKNRLKAANAVRQLVAFLKDPDRPVRDRIAASLLRVGAYSDANLAEVVSGIKDGDGNVRKPCVITLQMLGQPTPEMAAEYVLPEVVVRLNQSDGQTRDPLHGAQVIFDEYRKPEVAAQIVPKVVASIKADPGARGPGGDALAALPVKQREEATDLLIPFMKEKDEGVRSGAADALGKLGIPRSVPVLVKAMEETGQVRRVAIGAIALVAHPSGEKPLVEALDNPDDDNDARAQAAAGLGRIATPGAIETLVKALDDYDLKVQVSATSALARAGARAVPRLLGLLASGDEHQKLRAIQALAGIKAPQANAALAGVLRSGASARVRAEAASALGFAGNQAAVGALVAALGDRDSSVAAAAGESLAQIGPAAKPALTAAAAGSGPAAYFADRALTRLDPAPSATP